MLKALCRHFTQYLSLLHSFSSACSPDVVSFSSPRSFASLCSVLPSAQRLVTAPNRIRSTARLDIHDLSIHQYREGEKKKREMVVYLCDRDMVRRKIGSRSHLQAWITHGREDKHVQKWHTAESYSCTKYINKQKHFTSSWASYWIKIKHTVFLSEVRKVLWSCYLYCSCSNNRPVMRLVLMYICSAADWQTFVANSFQRMRRFSKSSMLLCLSISVSHWRLAGKPWITLTPFCKPNELEHVLWSC